MRFTKITIDNIKNVEHGEIDFTKGGGPCGANISGVYGPNDSGKSTLISCFELFRWMAADGLGDKRYPFRKFLPHDLGRLVRFDAASARIVFELRGDLSQNNDLRIKYELEISKKPDGTGRRSFEALHYALEGGGRMRKAIQVDSSNAISGAGITPNSLSNALDNESAIFWGGSSIASLFDDARRPVITDVLQAVHDFAQRSLFIMTEDLQESITHGWLPLIVSYADKVYIRHLALFDRPIMPLSEEHKSDMAHFNPDPMPTIRRNNNINQIMQRQSDFGNGLSELNGYHSVVPFKSLLHLATLETLNDVNTLASLLIPDLKIVHHEVPFSRLYEQEDAEYSFLHEGRPRRHGEYSKEWDEEDAGKGYLYLTASHNGHSWPLGEESRGTLKLISIASLLLAIGRNKNATVIVDELDAGIFEYLLGDILKVLFEDGAGQLIFTAHNHRPLVSLKKPGCIVFTTTDSRKRFARMTNIKSSNNLREVYRRTINKDLSHQWTPYDGNTKHFLSELLTSETEIQHG